jgi:paraquat-inducible protein B
VADPTAGGRDWWLAGVEHAIQARPTITISFETAEGLQAGQSQLKFKEIVLGTVKSLELTSDHRRVLVKVGTTRQAESLLTNKTIFWVVKPRLFAGNVEGLSTLASGSYIGMLPANTNGKLQREFVGREEPPVLDTNVPGHTFELKAAHLSSISLGSPIFYRDLDVGTVLGWDVGDMANSVTIHAFIRAPYDSYVHDETRFWNASGFAVKLGATGVEVQLESLRALLLGGIAFDTPAEYANTGASAENHVFPLFADQDAATAASYTRSIPLVSYFPGSVRGLGPGSEVTIHGLMVGHVTSVGLAYDAEKGAIVAPVHYEGQPERVVGLGHQVLKTLAAVVEAVIKRGLRATLESTNLITGQKSVAFDFVQNAPSAAVTMEGNDFVFPTTEGGGLAGLQSSVADLLGKVNAIPFDQIGKNLNGILLAANDVANGAELRQSLNELSAIIARVKDMADHLDSGATPALRQLPEIASGLQKTIANANLLVQSVGNGYGDNTKFNRDMDRLLLQASEALTSVRAFADMLSRDPQALIKGRPTGGTE